MKSVTYNNQFLKLMYILCIAIHTQNWIKIINAFYHNIITCCPDLTFLASLNFLCRSFNIPFFEFFLAPSRWGKWKIPLKTWLVKSRFFLRRHKIDYESIKIHYTCSIPRVFLEKNRLRKYFIPLKCSSFFWIICI